MRTINCSGCDREYHQGNLKLIGLRYYCEECLQSVWGYDPKSQDPEEHQEGGDHYKQYKIQPVEFFYHNQVPALEANVIKYVMRHKNKNGIQDLRKAKHYLELLAKYEYEDLL